MSKVQAMQAAKWAEQAGFSGVKVSRRGAAYRLVVTNPRQGGDLISESLDDLKAWTRRWAPDMGMALVG